MGLDSEFTTEDKKVIAQFSGAWELHRAIREIYGLRSKKYLYRKGFSNDFLTENELSLVSSLNNKKVEIFSDDLLRILRLCSRFEMGVHTHEIIMACGEALVEIGKNGLKYLNMEHGHIFYKGNY